MKEEKIDELVKHFSEKESYPEILNTKVNINIGHCITFRV